MSDLKKIKDEFLSKLKGKLNLSEINEIKTNLFGKNGLISSQFKKIGSVAENERKNFASDLNNIKDELQNLINLKTNKLSNPKNNDFNNKLKSILGKNFTDDEFKNLVELNDQEFKSSILDKFQKLRKDRVDKLGEIQSKDIEKRIFLQTIDLNWKSHIQYLEQLRQVIGLRSYGQRDPLIEYKKEAFNLFENSSSDLK